MSSTLEGVDVALTAFEATVIEPWFVHGPEACTPSLRGCHDDSPTSQTHDTRPKNPARTKPGTGPINVSVGTPPKTRGWPVSGEWDPPFGYRA